MKSFFKAIVGILEAISLFIVGFFGIKYLFVAGPILFGATAGYIVAGVITFFFIVPPIMGMLEWTKYGFKK